ncbi:MAG: hypothetical protein ABIQ77_01680 [Anaerolineales bacterium]
MKTNFRKWIPIALCCLPGVAVAAIVGVGIAAGGAALGTSLAGPLGIGLLVLTVLACPASMILMMRQRGSGQQSVSEGSTALMDCCLPTQNEEASTNQLASLRAKRESLEHELAALQSSK